jgi:hypothetical protein
LLKLNAVTPSSIKETMSSLIARTMGRKSAQTLRF